MRAGTDLQAWSLADSWSDRHQPHHDEAGRCFMESREIGTRLARQDLTTTKFDSGDFRNRRPVVTFVGGTPARLMTPIN